MIPCQLAHIPPHLHSNDKPLLPEFYVGEYVFRRCLPTETTNPFPTISLKDISVNRQGSNIQSPLCQPEDTLYALESVTERYENFVVVAMEVMEVEPEAMTYKKSFVSVNEDGNSSEATITLLHDPLPCNYAHSIFRLSVDNETVTADNYKKTLGKQNALAGKLREYCRHELAIMIVQNQIWINPPGLR